MKKILTVLGIIPARAGSKGVKRKNIYPVNGKPLIAYTIAAARRAKLLTDVIVSTESRTIAAIARRYQANVPFLRPQELARDDTPSLPVLRHALLEYEKLTGGYFAYVMLLQPTTPLRRAEDIDRAITLLKKSSRKRSLISCYNGRCVHPRIMYKKDKGKVVPYVDGIKEMNRRQGFEDVYVRNGAIYLTPRELLLNHGQVIGQNPVVMEMPRLRSFNIDSYEDLEIVKALLRGH
jgi:CMP-N-acetylneuraminic acid synthetase